MSRTMSTEQTLREDLRHSLECVSEIAKCHRCDSCAGNADSLTHYLRAALALPPSEPSPECPDCNGTEYRTEIVEQDFMYGLLKLKARVKVFTCSRCDACSWTGWEAEEARTEAIIQGLQSEPSPDALKAADALAEAVEDADWSHGHARLDSYPIVDRCAAYRAARGAKPEQGELIRGAEKP